MKTKETNFNILINGENKIFTLKSFADYFGITCYYMKKNLKEHNNDAQYIFDNRFKVFPNNLKLLKEYYTGKKIYELTILDIIKKDNGKYAIYQCSCGKKGEVLLTLIKKNKIKSCGHKKFFKEHERLIGKQFGELTILSIDTRNKVSWAKCQCSCGVIKDCKVNSLKTGNTRSCGHIKRFNKDNYADYIGYKFNKLTILDIFKRGRYVFAQCKCDCGRESINNFQSVKRGEVLSCHECKSFNKSNYEYYIGKTYNELTIIDVIKKNNRIYAVCNCSCGLKGKETVLYNVIYEKTKSCGHLIYSKIFSLNNQNLKTFDRKYLHLFKKYKKVS